MAEVVSKENLVTCPHCESLIRYDKSDLKRDSEFAGCGTVRWTYIECSNCKKQIQF